MKAFLVCCFILSSFSARASIKVGEEGLVSFQTNQLSCRAYGVNYFDVFHRILGNDFYDYKIGFSELSFFAIPFIRFSAMGYWPKDSALYFENKSEYFRRMDLIFSEAEKYKVGLIPSLFFNLSAVSDLMGEPTNAWGQIDSKTTLFMKQYVREFLLRYSDSKALWGIEFSNERNLYSDLPNASKFRPGINVAKGTPSVRTSEDSLSFNELQFSLRSFTEEVRKYNSKVLISSGNSLPRRYSYNNMRFNSWKLDSIFQMEYMLRAGIPNEVDSLSVHLYPHHRKKLAHFGKDGVISYEEILRSVQKVALEENKVVFVGEFGISSVGKSTDKERREFSILMESIHNSGVNLAALWVYRFSYQSQSFDVRKKGARRYQLDKVMEFNSKLEQAGELCKF